MTEQTEDKPASGLPGRRLRAVLWGCAALSLCVALSIGGHWVLSWIAAALDLTPDRAGLLTDARVFGAVLLIYVVVLALPFVPGTELGVFLLAAFGAKAALPVYGATVAALTLSFLIGRAIPLPRLVAGLRASGLERAAALLETGDPLAVAGAQPDLRQTLLARVLRYRCVVLGLLFNTPGNSLIGGGGGIALAVGASRLLSAPLFILTVLVAVAPVPLAVLLAAGFAS